MKHSPLLYRCCSARTWLLTAIVLAMTVTTAFAQVQQPGNAAGFEIDGNLLCTDVNGWNPPVAPGEDWHFNPADALCVGVIDNTTCTPNPARLPALFLRDPHWAGNATDVSSFDGQSNKNNDNIAPGADEWTVTDGSGPQKNDLTEIFIHSRTDINGDLWIILAAATRATNGDSHVDFEFNRAGLTYDSNTQLISGNGPSNGRTIGDLIVSIDYENGGTDPIPHIREWDGTMYQPLVTPAGSWYSATNQNFNADAPCGATASNGSIVNSYEPLQIAEVAINLSVIGIDPSSLCSGTSTVMVKSRSSQEFTAELKDHILAPFSIVEPPVCSISGPNEICDGETAQLCGPAGYTYLWNTGETTQCIDATLGGTYTLVITDPGTGCQSECTFDLTVNPNPTAAVPDAEVCEGSTTELCANASGGTGPYTYLWSTGETTECITVGTAGVYSVTVTDAKGCEGSDSGTLTVNPNPTANIGDDVEVCDGSTAELCANASGGTGPYTYLWSTGETTECITVGTAGDYTVTVTDSKGCEGSDTGTLTVNPNPTAAVPDAQVCEGSTTELCANASGGTGPYTYLWSTGETTECITVGTAGDYTVTVTDSKGCEGSDTGTLTVSDDPTCTITGPSAVCEGETAELCGPAGNFDYLWSTGETTQCITVGTAGTYSLTVTDKATGCESMCEHTLVVNPLPTCSITGPTLTCEGQDVELCGPDGNYSYSWTGPGGFTASTRCVMVSAAGDYQLEITDLATKCTSSCSHHLDTEVCVENCPRTPGFWAAQCDQNPTGQTKFDLAAMTQISECVDDHVGIFNWPAGTDFEGFCATVSTGGTMDQRRQAKRQFAAFLANVCTGQLGLIANNGDVIFLNLSTPVSCSGLSSTTLGDLIGEVDQILLNLEGASLADPQVKAMYSQIISCLDDINNAENVGPVCQSASAQNELYRDYVGSWASSITGDLVELYRPSPNPFRDITRIAFVVRSGEDVQIDVYDLAGRRVRMLASGFKEPGRYQVTWDGTGDDGVRVRAGLYFIRSIVAGQQTAMRVIYVR